MWKSKTCLIIFLFLICCSAQAKKQYLLIGGGGEPSTSLGTIFDEEIQGARSFLNKAPMWEKDVSFNGGHPKTEAILRTDFSDVQSTSFTEEEYRRLIKKYKTRLKNGELKKGDQLLIHIESHGAIKVGNQETHSVSLARNALKNYDTLGGRVANLDELKEITELAKQKGVLVGIIDDSCHSGNTQSLANEVTCVLSATGPIHYGYNGLNTQTDRIVKNLTPGKSLEEVFLKARSESVDSGFPMISSPEGKAVQADIYSLITPYLYFVDKKHDKLTPYLSNPKLDVCDYDKRYQELMTVINQVEKVTTKLKNKELEGLEKSIKTYYDFQRSMINQTQSENGNLLGKEEKIVGREGKYLATYTFSWRELLTIDYEKRISDLEQRLKRASSKEQLSYKIALSAYRQAQTKAQEIHQKYPSLNVENDQQLVSNKEQYSYELARKIGKQSRILYDVLYREELQKRSRESNPCREFIL